jgi:hypothetical protein
MKRMIMTAAASLAAAALLITSSTPSASAHERRAVAGKFTFVVGFLNEPALLEEPNGISLAVTNSQTNEPVEGVEKTLKADIIVGGETKTVDLRARFGMKGAYTSDIFPTKTGTWVFRFYGNIDGTQIDERFESGPGRFNDVEAKTNIAFPSKQPSIGELAQRVQTGNAPGESSAQPSNASADDVQRALDKANSARNTAVGFGIAGIVVGVLGVALGAYALTTRRSDGARSGSEPV